MGDSDDDFSPLGGPARVNPLDDFNTYEGGFDPSSEDYLASLAMTGVYGFVLALLWIVFTLLYVIIRCICSCLKSKQMV